MWYSPHLLFCQNINVKSHTHMCMLWYMSRTWSQLKKNVSGILFRMLLGSKRAISYLFSVLSSVPLERVVVFKPQRSSHWAEGYFSATWPHPTLVSGLLLSGLWMKTVKCFSKKLFLWFWGKKNLKTHEVSYFYFLVYSFYVEHLKLFGGKKKRKTHETMSKYITIF